VLVVAVAALVVRAAMAGAGWDPYLIGIRAQLAHQSVGHPAFFLGEISSAGWVSYFPVALLMKLPPATLLLALVSVFVFRRGAPWARRAVGRADSAGMSAGRLAVRAHRHRCPLRTAALAHAHLTASRVATLSMPMSPRYAVMVGLMLVQHVGAAVRIAPHDLAFFSDLVGGPSRGQRYLADSNLDWGQDVETLGRWLASRERPRRLYLSYFGTADPRAYGVSYYPAPNSCAHQAPWTRELEPASGRELLAVSAMNLQACSSATPPRTAGWPRGGPSPCSAIRSRSTTSPTIRPRMRRSRGMYERYGPKGTRAGRARTRGRRVARCAIARSGSASS
jgi:hypothetical protein